jgi:hypothetical protein
MRLTIAIAAFLFVLPLRGGSQERALAVFALAAPDRAAQQPAARHQTSSSRADDSTEADLGPHRCFGISFGRDCPIMLQYEAGYRFRASGRSPRVLPPDQARLSQWRKQFYASGGLMIATGSRSAVGLLYERGNEGDLDTDALGARWARQLRGDVRVDVTAGALWKPVQWYDQKAARRATATSPGAFAEVTFHPFNLLSLSVRDESHPPSSHASGGQAIYIGARLEAVPALVVTAIVAAVTKGIGGSLRNW